MLLSFLVLMVIVAVVYQLNRSTSIDQQVAHKDVILARMDLAIESAFLEVAEQLLSDAELKQAGEEEGAGGAEEEALVVACADGTTDRVAVIPSLAKWMDAVRLRIGEHTLG